MGVFGTIYDTLDAISGTAVADAAANAASLAQGAVVAGIGVYMLVACYAVLRGIAGEGFGHVITQGIKASLVLLAVTSGIGGVTAASVNGWPDQLGGGAAGNVGAQADQFTSRITSDLTEAIDEIRDEIIAEGEESGGVFGFIDESTAVFAAYLTWGILMVVAIFPIAMAHFLAAIMVTIAVFLKFALAVTAAFGPLFVGLLLFDSTRPMFFTWLQAALSYALATVILGITIGFIFDVGNATTDTILNSIGGYSGAHVDATIIAMLALTGIYFVGLFFILQAQGIAQGMSGGGGGSGAGVAGALIPSTFTVRALTRGASGAVSRASSRFGAAGRGVGTAAGNAARWGSVASRRGMAVANRAARMRAFRAQTGR
jgi:type IV secretion system protein VirB6